MGGLERGYDEAKRMTAAPPDYDGAIAAIRKKFSGSFPKTALILGSGLGPFGDKITREAVIPYQDIPGFPVSTVFGHQGRLLIGRVADKGLICLQGRMHIYEGNPAQAIAFPIRVLRRMGVERLILTNAAGGVRRDLVAGTLVLVTDHINLSGQNPLIGPNDESFGPRFFDMSNAYDVSLRAQFTSSAQRAGVDLTTGVYVYTLGPNFETPAEIRMFATVGADAVGMSTVPECLVANHCGMRVAAISLITNLAAGLSETPLSHEETLAEAAKAYGRVERLLLQFFADLED
jgi:inosine/guanosine/xanthosine phosphorylase family protein